MTDHTCRHRYLTAFPGSGGWVCADCKVKILSLVLPLPMPLVEQAMAMAFGRAACASNEPAKLVRSQAMRELEADANIAVHAIMHAAVKSPYHPDVVVAHNGRGA